MIMCVLLCYPVSIHMSRLQATGRPISSCSLFLFFDVQVLTLLLGKYTLFHVQMSATHYQATSIHV